MSEWKEYLLEDIIDTFIDYRGKTPKKSESGIPLVTAKVIKSGKILTPNEFIKEDEYENWMTRGYPKKNDVVLTTEAPLGEVALIKDENIALAQRIITMRGNSDVVSNVFLKYYFQSDQGQYELDSRASGTTVLGIKASVLRQVPVFLPSLPEQRAIAEVLSSLDDKIDLLHRQNQTLEALAQTLFRQWFIEEAQDDWEEVELGEVIKIQNGYAFKSKSFVTSSNNRIIKIKNIQSGVVDLNNSVFIPDEIAESVNKKFRLGESDILIAMTGAEIGKLGVIGHSPNRLFLNQRVGKLFAEDKRIEILGYYYLTSEEGQNHIIHTASGSAQPNISASGIEKMKIELPKKIDGNLSAVLDSMYHAFQKRVFNLGQITTLENLRDTLLPKLMSGQVRVDVDAINERIGD